MNRLSNLPPGVTDKDIEDWQEDCPCDDDDHDWTEAIHPDDETIRVTYCHTCGTLKEEG